MTDGRFRAAWARLVAAWAACEPGTPEAEALLAHVIANEVGTTAHVVAGPAMTRMSRGNAAPP